MKTLFIFLLIGIWIILKFIRYEKKKKMQVAAQSIQKPNKPNLHEQKRQAPQYSMETLLEGLLGGNITTQTNQPPEVVEESFVQPEFVEGTDYKKKVYSQKEYDKVMYEGRSSLENTSFKDEVLEVEDIEENNDTNKIDFDLKKAVLFSEILRNPYIENKY